jgi:hypothetical protein
MDFRQILDTICTSLYQYGSTFLLVLKLLARLNASHRQARDRDSRIISTMRPSSTTRCLRAFLQFTNVQCSAPARRYYGSVSSVTSRSTNQSAIPASIPRNLVFQQAIEATEPRISWTREEIQQIYDTPLIELAFAAVSSPH